MILDGVKGFFKSCPFLKSGKIDIENLGEEPVRYCIETVPANPIIKRFADGGAQKQALFLFSGREWLDEKGRTNLDNSGFYEKLAEWIEEQDNAKNYPQLGEGKTPVRIEVLTGGYLMDAKADRGRYQLQFRVIYETK